MNLAHLQQRWRLPLEPSLGRARHPSTHLSTASRSGIIDIPAIGLACVFYLITQLGLITAYDGTIFVVLLAWLAPSWSPTALLLALSVHDAPGMATPSLYIAIAGIAGAFLRDWLASRGRYRDSMRRVKSLAISAVITIVYGIACSFWQDSFGEYPQSSARNYLLVGAFSILMVGAACAATLNAQASSLQRARLASVCLVAISHIILITAIQLKAGPSFAKSAQGVIVLSEDAALIESGSQNFSRLTGPFLTPNNLGSVTAALLLLFLIQLNSVQTPGWFLFAYVSCGGIVSVLGASRSMLLYYAATTGLLCWSRYRFLAVILLGGAASICLSAGLATSGIAQATRFDDFNWQDSTRMLLWTTAIDTLRWWDWLTGIGLAGWDDIFGEVYTSSRISDPHTWVLSITGSFGLVGLWFYGRLILGLSATAWDHREKLRTAGACLIVFVLLRDLVVAQNILNNHPTTCLNWFVLCSHFASVHASPTVPHNSGLRHRPRLQPSLARCESAGSQHR